MDKNTIKNSLKERFLGEADLRKGSTPGINLTAAIRTKSGKENKKALKDMQKDLSAYDKSVKSDFESDSENKFNYNSETEETYHAQMEDMNGNEMLEFDREPNKQYKDRAIQAIEGSANMGNDPKWANVVPKQQGFTGPDFGKNLVKNIKASHKKRQDATDRVISFGDDIETVPKGSNPIARHSAYSINEGVSEKGIAILEKWISESGERGAAVKIIDQILFKVTGGLRSSDLTDSATFANGLDEIEDLLADKDYDNALEVAKETVRDMMEDEGFPMFEDKNNKKPQIKEGMKRLNFKKEFNGVGNALKMIPESYKVDNKVFEMTDGVESYKIRWEGSLNEGKAVVLMASDKNLVNEDMNRMKQLMGYKSQDTLGIVKGKARLDENKVFGDIWNKTKTLLETEDMEGADATEGNWDGVTKKAPEATKHVQGSVKKDSANAKGKEGNPDKAVKHAPEAKTPMKSSKGANIESDADATEGNWDDVKKKAPEATKHVTMKESYEMEEEVEETEEVKTEGKTKEANWDKAGIKQAPEAKKHVHMGKESKANLETEGKEEAVTEGIIINGIEFLPLNENWMGEETLDEEVEESMYEEEDKEMGESIYEAHEEEEDEEEDEE
jgi:hypothetical protein